MLTIGNNLKKFRHYYCLSQSAIATELNISHQAISQWEHNASYTDIENLVKLSHFFKCDINQLLFDHQD
ncbi:helix-turn-helix domain-containing protein [Lentilactobacillus hilgardii]|uniref:helix-turn-helix domain-containing protein n=1 Tax=Lentilactobacillus hilgardii TaxID=1588 RepID=UPI0039E9B120